MFNKEHYEEVMAEWPSYDTRRIVKDGETPGKRAEYRLSLIAGFNNASDTLKRELYEDYLIRLVNTLRTHDDGKFYRKFTVPVGLNNPSLSRWLTTAIS